MYESVLASPLHTCRSSLGTMIGGLPRCAMKQSVIVAHPNFDNLHVQEQVGLQHLLLTIPACNGI